MFLVKNKKNVYPFTFQVPTRSGTNRAVLAQKVARSLNFGFRKKGICTCTIRVAKTKVPISFGPAPLISHRQKSGFSHDAVLLLWRTYGVSVEKNCRTII